MYSRRSPRNVKLQCRPIRSQHFIMNNLFLLINFIKFSFWLKWTFGTNCYIQLRVFEKKKHLLFFFSLCYTCNFYHVCHHILQLNFISLVFIEAFYYLFIQRILATKSCDCLSSRTTWLWLWDYVFAKQRVFIIQLQANQQQPQRVPVEWCQQNLVSGMFNCWTWRHLLWRCHGKLHQSEQ